MSNERIAIFTHLDDNFKEIDEVVRENHVKYSSSNNHEYIKLSTKEIVDHKLINNEMYWVKIMGALNVLNTRQDIDWLFMVDLDVVFNKMNIPLSFFTKCASLNQDILMCNIGNRIDRDYWHINIGSVFFKNTEYVKDFLSFFLEIGKNSIFSHFEQPVLQSFLKNNDMSILDKVGFFPEHSFNHGSSQTFLYHACGEGASTSNTPFDKALPTKVDRLRKVLNGI